MFQVSAADEVEVEQLDILWRSFRVDALEEFVDFFASFLAELFDVVLHINLFEQDLVLIERLEC